MFLKQRTATHGENPFNQLRKKFYLSKVFRRANRYKEAIASHIGVDEETPVIQATQWVLTNTPDRKYVEGGETISGL